MDYLVFSSHSIKFSPPVRENRDESETLLLVQASPTPSSESGEETRSVDQVWGLIILSLFVFLFLSYLLWKRRFREVRFGLFATLCLGILLPVLLILKTTTDWLNQPEALQSEQPTKPSPTGRPEQLLDKIQEQETPPPLSDSEAIEEAEEVSPEDEEDAEVTEEDATEDNTTTETPLPEDERETDPRHF